MHLNAIIKDLRQVRPDDPEAVRATIERAIQFIETMGEQFDQLKWRASQKFRPSSEKVNPNQLALQLLSCVLNTSAQTQHTSRGLLEDENPVVERKRPPKRTSKVRLLPVEVVDKTLPDEALQCGCGAARKPMGYDTRKQIIFRPAKMVMQEERLHKYACRKCAEGVMMAPATPKLLDKSLASSSLLAHLVVSKVIDCVPIERVGKQLARHGADIAPSTLYDWFALAGEEVLCLQPQIRASLLQSRLISQDDTPLPTKNLAHVNNIQRGRLWLYLGDLDRVAYSAFSEDWKGTHPCRVLDGFSGDIQGDGYGGVNALFNGNAPPTRVGCHDHARRKFVEALNMGDNRAQDVVALYQKLYAVERRGQRLDAAALLALRQEHAVPIWQRIDQWVAQKYGQVSRKGPLGKATTYWHKQRRTLEAYLHSGHRPISNGHVERQLRTVALLRKNALFMGSIEGGHRYAALLTMALNCSIAGANPLAYFTWLFDRLVDRPGRDEVLGLLPQAWLKASEAA